MAGINRAGVAVMDMKLEVVVVPVSGVDQAKAFYQGLDGNGWFVQEITTRLPGR
jgi:hypothetical protein